MNIVQHGFNLDIRVLNGVVEARSRLFVIHDVLGTEGRYHDCHAHCTAFASVGPLNPATNAEANKPAGSVTFVAANVMM